MLHLGTRDWGITAGFRAQGRLGSRVEGYMRLFEVEVLRALSRQLPKPQTPASVFVPPPKKQRSDGPVTLRGGA